jgi:alkylated DNA nucleotide flippase Atl1
VASGSVYRAGTPACWATEATEAASARSSPETLPSASGPDPRVSPQTCESASDWALRLTVSAALLAALVTAPDAAARAASSVWLHPVSTVPAREAARAALMVRTVALSRGTRGSVARQTDAVPCPIADLPEFAARVLDVVDRVPAGRVVTYGDVAEYLGVGGPRQVGAVMSRHGAAVAWWRVLHADGSPPPGLESEALARLRAEGTALRASGTRVDLARARWDGDDEPDAG